MQSVLNFSEQEKKPLRAFLKNFPSLKMKTSFEEAKAEIEGCAVTLYKSGKLLIQGKSHEKAKQKILAAFEEKSELVLGIDETGRGESFGSLVVAGVLGETSRLRELRDSKKTKNISEKSALAEKNLLGKKIIEISASKIDSLRQSGKNLNLIEAEAMNEIISFFEKNFPEKKFRIIIDGSRIRGVKEKRAEFLPKADDKIVQVSAASVLAKNVRDKSPDSEKRKTWKTK
ncbi:MAG TPA: DUF3378 domain-containing protein [archaeon]|nr:DUF3378 domain-containing protein [archaeon]